MNTHSTISELSTSSVSDFITDEKVRKFAPVQCSVCHCKGPFKRRIFRIEGKHRMDQDKTQDLFRLQIRKEYGLENVFFRTHRNVHYADVAICCNCGTTKVMYDIEFDGDLFATISKMLNVPEETVKKDMQKVCDDINKNNSVRNKNADR